MNTSLLSKIFGWGQFALTTLGTVFSNGIPTTVPGWVLVGASLATAIANHNASNTAGPTPTNVILK